LVQFTIGESTINLGIQLFVEPIIGCRGIKQRDASGDFVFYGCDYEIFTVVFGIGNLCGPPVSLERLDDLLIGRAPKNGHPFFNACSAHL
jgi:hypothetical protein